MAMSPGRVCSLVWEGLKTKKDTLTERFTNQGSMCWMPGESVPDVLGEAASWRVGRSTLQGE